MKTRSELELEVRKLLEVAASHGYIVDQSYMTIAANLVSYMMVYPREKIIDKLKSQAEFELLSKESSNRCDHSKNENSD